jgi:hypothetical protein
MSNIINLTWNGATDDVGIARYELQWRLSPNSPWSTPPILVPHNLNYLNNTTTSGGGSYSHTITQLANHYFRLRIVDSIGQFSSYKEIFVPVDTNVILISATCSTDSTNICIANTYNPVNPIILLDNNTTSTNLITPGLTYVKNINNTTFNGFNRFWRILLLDNYSYNCEINTIGKIVNVEICDISSIRSEKRSEGYSSNLTSSAICDAGLDYDIYYDGSLGIGTIIYTVLNYGSFSGSFLSSPFPGANKYYLISEDLSTYIVKILNNGSVDSIQTYLSVCPTIITINTCCFVKGTKITMSDYTTKNIEDVKIGDFVITYNEETKEQEPGEVVKVVSPMRSDIVEYELSNGISIKSTTCHPYWVVNKGWSSFNPEITKKLYNFDVDQIEESDTLLTIDNKEVIVDKITELITKEVITYNLGIMGNHTYYANNILVHNKTAEPNKFESDGETITTAWQNWNNQYAQIECIAAEPTFF